MKKIKTKLMIGIGIIFLISYGVMMINIGTNQRIINKSGELLESNYTSLQYAYEMLNLLDQINLSIASDFADDQLEKNTFAVFENLKKLEQLIELQKNNITEAGELQITQRLERTYNIFNAAMTSVNTELNFDNYSRLYRDFRENIVEIYDMNSQSLENKNNTITKDAEHILQLQKNVGIVGLTLLAILIVFIPLYLIHPLDKLTIRLIDVYEKAFNKEVVLQKGHELEKLEEIIEKIIEETSTGIKKE